MLVAKYWAEARLQHKFSARKQKNSQITIRRLGWSNESQQAAEAIAQQRAKEAMQQAIQDPEASSLQARRENAGEGYNGADGLPIREEIVEENNKSVITRNSYGALCLNTPDVMFIDIDDNYQLDILGKIGSPTKIKAWMVLAILIWMIFIYKIVNDFVYPGTDCYGLPKETSLIWSFIMIMGSVFIAMFFSAVILFFLSSLFFSTIESIYRIQHSPLKRIESFARKHPQWIMNLYRTKAGYRLLVLHQKFDPTDELLWKSLHKLGVDPLYSRMCRLQKCFRARLTPKPWRIGIQNPIAKGRRAWHARYAQMLERIQWVADYQKLSCFYASCHLVKQYSPDLVQPHLDPEIEAVLLLHDKLTQAHSDLPLA